MNSDHAIVMAKIEFTTLQAQLPKNGALCDHFLIDACKAFVEPSEWFRQEFADLRDAAFVDFAERRDLQRDTAALGIIQHFSVDCG